MSHVDEIPEAASGGVLPELRSGSATEAHAVPPVRAKERRARQAELAITASANAPGEDARPGATAPAEGRLSVGDRVSMTGEVVIVSTVGSPWLFVRLDGGEREHTVAVALENVTRAEPHKGDARRSDNEGKGNG